jgi:hypothetical protein
MDGRLLRAEIVIKGYSLSKFLALCGLSKSAFYRKTKGQSYFSTHEVERIRNTLDLSSEKLVQIFFADKVS